jgi:hypothetical protein
MTWIKSHATVAQHPKVRRAAKALQVSVPEMIGHLHLLWWWCLEFAQDGDVSPFSAEELADAAMWEGDAEAFVQSLMNCGLGDGAGLLEIDESDRLVVHDWMEYAGVLVERRKADAERKREARRKASSSDTARPSGGRPSPVRETSVARVDKSRVEKNREEEVHGAADASHRPQAQVVAVAAKVKPKARAADPLWDAAVQLSGYEPANERERGKWNAALKALRESAPPVDAGELEMLYARYELANPGLDRTVMAVAGQVAKLRAWKPRTPQVKGAVDVEKLKVYEHAVTDLSKLDARLDALSAAS